MHPQSLLISIQVICFSLTWLHLVYGITPTLYIFSFFTHQEDPGTLPQWMIHTNYMIAAVLATTGTGVMIRLKILRTLLSVAITFLGITLAGLCFQAPGYLINLPLYLYIVLLPLILYNVLEKRVNGIRILSRTAVAAILLGCALLWCGWLVPGPEKVSGIFRILSPVALLIAAGIFWNKYEKRALQFSVILIVVHALSALLNYRPDSADFFILGIPIVILRLAPVFFISWLLNIYSPKS